MAKTTKSKKVATKKAPIKSNSKKSTTKVSKKGTKKVASKKTSTAKKAVKKTIKKAASKKQASKSTKSKKQSKVTEPSLVREVSAKEPTTSYLSDAKTSSKKENYFIWKVIAAVVALLAIIFILISITPSFEKETDISGLNAENGMLENTLIVVTDSTCTECETKDVIEVSKQLFGNITVLVYDYASEKEAKDLVEKTGTQVIPIYLFSSDVKENPNYAKVSQAMVDLGDILMINPAATPGGKLLKDISESPIKGDLNAPVRIIEWSDFECPYCAKFYSEGYQQILTEYVDKGLVSIEFRHFPLQFHNNAMNAAMASECAFEQGKFWEYHDKLYENIKALSIVDLKQYAVDLSLDTTKFNVCIDSQKYKEKVETDMQYGSIKGVSGTPGFLIGNQVVAGALPFEQFKIVIDAELAKVNS